MVGETLHSNLVKTFDFCYADLQRLMVAMVDPSSEGEMVAPPPPSNKRIRQHNEVGPLV
jgi:hypothetical protein